MRSGTVGLLLIAWTLLAGCRSQTPKTGMLEDSVHRATSEDSLLATAREPLPIPVEAPSWLTAGVPAGMVQDTMRMTAPRPSGIQAAEPIKAPTEPRSSRP